MKKIIIAVGVIIIVLIVGSYSMNSNAPEEIKGENLEGEADPSRMTLDMKTWIWVSELNDAGDFTLTFGDDGKFSATTDCNSMGGTYAADKDAISFSDIFTTLMYCEGSQESAFASMLRSANAYHFTSRGQLIFDLKSGGQATFR